MATPIKLKRLESSAHKQPQSISIAIECDVSAEQLACEHEALIKDRGEETHDDRGIPQLPDSSEQHVNWGIAWHRPELMVVSALAGIMLAIGHHFYYVWTASSDDGMDFSIFKTVEK